MCRFPQLPAPRMVSALQTTRRASAPVPRVVHRRVRLVPPPNRGPLSTAETSIPVSPSAGESHPLDCGDQRGVPLARKRGRTLTYGPGWPIGMWMQCRSRSAVTSILPAHCRGSSPAKIADIAALTAATWPSTGSRSCPVNLRADWDASSLAQASCLIPAELLYFWHSQQRDKVQRLPPYRSPATVDTATAPSHDLSESGRVPNVMRCGRRRSGHRMFRVRWLPPARAPRRLV